MTHVPHNLLSDGVPETLLPEDPAVARLEAGEVTGQVVRDLPASSAAWAQVAEDALGEDDPSLDVIAYACARTGYHRGLDALRRAGWRGTGPVPWEHEPNRGFLRCVAALATAAARFGESDEEERCWQLLRDSSETAFAELGPR